MIPNTICIDNKLIIVGSGLHLSDDELREFNRLVTQITNWEVVLQKAAKQHVLSNIYKNLLKSGNKHLIPSQIFESLKKNYIKTLISNTKMHADIVKIIHKLNENHIDVILLKGILLNQILYNDKGTRRMGDIDLLVNPKDLEKAKDVFLENGWSIYQNIIVHKSTQNYNSINAISHTPYKFRNENACVELHRQLLTYNLLFDVKLSSFFTNTEKIDMSGEKAYMFNYSYLMIHLCLHAINDMYRGGAKLKHLLDIAEILKSKSKIDFKELKRACDENNCLTEVQKIFNLCNTYFNAPIDYEFMNNKPFQLKRIINYDKLFEHGLQKNSYGKIVFILFGIYRRLFLLKTVDSFAAKFKIIKSEFIPSKEHRAYKKGA